MLPKSFLRADSLAPGTPAVLMARGILMFHRHDGQCRKDAVDEIIDRRVKNR